MNRYKALINQIFSKGAYSLVPIRFQDRYAIMKWRNEQIYHLRQSRPLTQEDQDLYFNSVISELFDQEQPDQIIFSYLEGDRCIGYGGLVHINWQDQNAEISFVMDTNLEKSFFEFHWKTYLGLIEKVAFLELNLHKIFTYAFDLRIQLYEVLEQSRFQREAVLKEHTYFGNKYIDVIIHSKINPEIRMIRMSETDIDLTFQWATNQTIRKYSLNQNKINFESHEEWFLNKIKNPNCEYFLFRTGNKAIGSVRFDIIPDEKSALISFLIDESFHGKGYGKSILVKGIDKLRIIRPEVKFIYGWVLNENIPSLKIFERLNFIKVERDYLKTKFVLNI